MLEKLGHEPLGILSETAGNCSFSGFAREINRVKPQETE
jgi:hypothetical protein